MINFLNFNIKEFFEFPGILILIGVVLLIIAIILAIFTFKKPSKKEAIVPQKSIPAQTVAPQKSIPDQTVAPQESATIQTVVPQESVPTQIVESQGAVEQVSTPPLEVQPAVNEEVINEGLPQGLTSNPLTGDKTVEINIPIIGATVNEEPLSNTLIYGGANPLDKINIVNEPVDKAPYGDENLKLSSPKETSTLDVTEKETEELL